ncbi:hypothetical protein C7N43_13805 [Sphingobacteriales bacterium UPWRP_1]|nr:hypothetical protein BVG80_15645 [Sphingobacteriales bacterium TSM_CSM]PSJ76451.1 hypothetical protein C7N43_13805 [Sphingobacteriales bacterium UPWRP_1]
MKEVYIISDLHLGGEPAKPTELRGFQLNTHGRHLAAFITQLAEQEDRQIELIINGDLVDFLAEAPWAAFEYNTAQAIQKLKRIMRREAPVFTALQQFLCSSNHSLVLLPGNHDLELCLPALRRVFEEAIGATGANFRFLYDGEAYIIGTEVLVEHGNRYDAWNSADDNNLRLLREKMSRAEKTGPDTFRAPKGSALVEQIMNPMKEKYRFIDLLKPETGAVIPILLALEPNLRTKIDDLLRIYLSDTALGGITGRNLPSDGTEKSGTTLAPEEDLVNRELQQLMNDEDLQEFLSATDAATTPEINTGNEDSTREPVTERKFDFGFVTGVLQLLLFNHRNTLTQRLPALLRALQALQNDKTFDIATETFTEYLTAAKKLAANGYRYIVFGHTHLAKKIHMGNDAWYFNSGTWADLMAFPTHIVAAGNKQTALAHLEQFVEEITLTNLAEHIRFNPTCVYIRLDAYEKVQQIDLLSYQWQTKTLEPLN